MRLLAQTPTHCAEYLATGPTLHLVRHLSPPARLTPDGLAWRATNAVHVEPHAGAPYRLPLPPGTVHDLLVHGETVYAAGLTEAGPRAWRYRGRWHPLPIPDQALRPGKAVDFLFTVDDLLLGVDDVVFPLYLLRWELPTHRPLPPLQLPDHGTYEHICDAALVDHRVALVSTTVNRGHWRYHAWTLDGSDGWQQDACWDLGPRDPHAGPPAVALVGDRVFVTTHEHGLLTMRPGHPPGIAAQGRGVGLVAAGQGVWWWSIGDPTYCQVDSPSQVLVLPTDDEDFDIPAFFRS